MRGVFYWDDGFDFNPEFGDMDEDFTFEPGARWVSESRLLYFLGAMGNAEYDLKGQLLPMLILWSTATNQFLARFNALEKTSSGRRHFSVLRAWPTVHLTAPTTVQRRLTCVRCSELL